MLQFGSIYSEVWSSVPCCLVVSSDLHCTIEYAVLSIVHSLTKLTVQLSRSITLSTESFDDVGEKKKKEKQQQQQTIALLVYAKLQCEEQHSIPTGSSWELDGN